MSTMEYRHVPVIQKVRKTCTLECPLVKRLAGIKEMKVEAITMGKLHDMSCPPYMRHYTAIVFHFFTFLLCH